MKARTRDADVHGALIVDKPDGPTSHDVVDRARRALGTRRIGHTGTLDPFATGVLVLCVGKATRLARFLSADAKEYRATVRLGFSTTTDDRTGEPLGPPLPVAVDEARLRAACERLRGEILQLPPAYSARRVGGRRLYELARAGAVTERTASPVIVHSLDVLEVRGDRLEIEVRCSAGTYVRSLARHIGEAIGLGGHLESLRRTRSGAFGLTDAVSGDDLNAGVVHRLMPLGSLLSDLAPVTVGAAGLELLRHGRDLSREVVDRGFPEAQPPERMRILGGDGALLALAVPRGFGARVRGLPVTQVLHPDVVLVD
jgi:tRNA pseudouridine55 synthase